MKFMTKYKLLFWPPRILALLFVGFLSIFALDVFSEYSGWSVVPALLIHLIPSFALLLIIIVAWKNDLIGMFVFLATGVGYVFLAGFDRPWSWYAGISGPSILVGILFMINYIYQRRHPLQN
jgi:cell division protein FtsW (lipid II flippase)